MRNSAISLGVLLFVSVCCADVITVNLDGSADYTTIQAAIDAAADGDEIVVSDGTYTGDGNRDIDFLGKAITVRSQNGPENCIIDPNGTSEYPHRAFIFQNAEDANSILDGFTIQNGYAPQIDIEGYYYSFGGGIYCSAVNPTISNCKFSNNTAEDLGGAIYSIDSNLTITDCIFSSGYSAGHGGGIFCRSGRSLIYRCTFTDNSAQYGAAVSATESYPRIESCTFINNSADEYGGAVRCGTASGWIKFSSPEIINCVFIANSAGGNGGAISLEYYINPVVTNCTIIDNTAEYGAGIFAHAEHTVVTNSIIRGNEPDQIDLWGLPTLLTHCNIEGGWFGEGNIDIDPGLIDTSSEDPSEWNLRLRPESLCIDAGLNRPERGLPETDIDGNPRIIDGDNDGLAFVDMGAYETIPCTQPAIRLSSLNMNFSAAQGQTQPQTQTLTVYNGGSDTLPWWIIEDCDWLSISPDTGTDRMDVTVSADASSLSAGKYISQFTVHSDLAVNSPLTVQVILNVYKAFYVPTQFDTIQAAVNAAENGDVVIVADGTYTGEGNRDIDFFGKAITVRSQNGPDTCVVDCGGRYGPNHRAFNFRNAEGLDSVLDGFTIVNGDALDEDLVEGSYAGGAIFCIDSSPTITNCIFKNNYSQDLGGAICIYSMSNIPSPHITNCIFDKNDAETSGGAIYFQGDDSIIENCQFYSNTARRGGALRTFFSSSVLFECRFVDNIATDGMGGAIQSVFGNFLIINCEFTANCAFTLENPSYGIGGALRVHDPEDIRLVDCEFNSNYADNKGGAIYSPETDLYNCSFTGNSASSGGALYSTGTSFGTHLKNCIMQTNSANLGACVYSEGLCTITNSTALDNSADSAAGVLYSAAQSNNAVTNSILRQNTAPDGPAIAAVDEALVTVSYNNIEGGQSALSEGPSATIEYLDGNIDAEVDFAFPDDLHLMAGSAGIDAGTNEPVNADLTSDFDANPRPLDGDGDSLAVADMGAFEFNPDLPSIALSITQIQLFVYQQTEGGFTSTEAIVQIRNCGSGSLNWQVVEDCPWLQATPSQGTSSGEIDEITFSWSGEEPNRHYPSYPVQICAADAVNSPRTIDVLMNFKTPLNVPDKYPTIQAAIDEARDGDTVIVADGTYTGYGNRDIDFLGKAITVRSQNGPETCIIDCQGSYGNWRRGFNFVSSEDPNSILDGFTITNGYMPSGGAISTYKSSPVIRNCVLKDNTADYGSGGAVVNDRSSPVIENCIFTGNHSTGIGWFLEGGGALCNDLSDPIIANCLFVNNSSDGSGGAIFNGSYDYDPYIASGQKRPFIINCFFSGNNASAGGAIYNGAIGFFEGYKNCGTHLSMENCTIMGNSAMNVGGLDLGGYSYSYSTVTNTIIWSNIDYRLPDMVIEMNEPSQIDGGTVDINYCCVQGWTGDLGGQGNMGENPLFIDPGYWDDNCTPDDWSDDTWIEGDYHLRWTSPCVDTGDPNYVVEEGEVDIDGEPRIMAGRIDMGVDEVPTHKPYIEVSANQLEFYVRIGHSNRQTKTLTIRNEGANTLNWTISENCIWLSAVPDSGSLAAHQQDEIAVTVDITGLEYGQYNCLLEIIDPDAANSPVVIEVKLYVGYLRPVPDEFSTIQAAIDQAYDWDLVLVADGVYTGDGNRDISFAGKAITVKSENGPDNCIIDCQASESNQHRGFFFNGGEEADSVVEGFTITNGYSNRGPGVFCYSSSPTITNCVITNNYATEYAAGLWCRLSSPTITNCTFTQNQAVQFGGAVYCYENDRPSFVRCLFDNNTAYAGGAVGCQNGNVSLSRCRFTSNTATGGGGAIFSRYSYLSLIGCFLQDNAATNGGALRCAWDCYVILDNSFFAGNNAGTVGGCLCSVGGVDETNWVRISNCTFSSNIAGTDGGAVWFNDVEESSLVITNSILWDNSPTEVNGYLDSIKIYHSDIKGGWEGTGNIDVEPKFVDSVNSDYHLLWTSPCINAGDPNYVVEEGEVDIDGEPRIMAGRIDMGADEVGPKQADFTRDGRIDIQDFAVLARSWDTTPTNENWYVLCDLFDDDIIDINDLAALAADWLWVSEWY